MDKPQLEELTTTAIDCAFRVHKALGPGLLESAYKACLAVELAEAGLALELEKPLPLIYKGRQVADIGYRLDILVAKELIIEVKSVEAIAPVHIAQLLSYLRLSDRRLGLLINFNVAMFKEGIKRVANRL